MSTASRKPTYIMRSNSDNDFYEADLHDDPHHPEAMWQVASRPIVDGLRQRRSQNNLHEPPPPSFVPGRPEQSFGGKSYSNTPDPRPQHKPEQEGDYFVIIRQLRSGGITGAFHLPRKTFEILFLLISVLVWALMQFPDLWKLVFGLL